MGFQAEQCSGEEQISRIEDQDDRSVDEVARELVRAQNRIADLTASLEAERRAHADLILILGHELRTPITVINGFSRLLEDSGKSVFSERQMHFIEQTRKACRHLDGLIGDLVEASPESNRLLALSSELGDLDETIRSTLEALSPQLADRGIQLELDLNTEVPEFIFDSVRIHQVLNNLLINAIRYGRPGGAIRVGRYLADSPGDPMVCVYVEDDGPGILDRDRRRVFEPYVRGEGHSACAGMGIGLAICHRIITSHAGAIRVEDGSKGGARFVFSLPITPGAIEE